MAKPNYQSLIDHIAEIEQERRSQDRRLRASQHSLEQERKLASRRLIELKVFETLNLGYINALSTKEIYSLACGVVTDQLKYVSALVITFAGNRGSVVASANLAPDRIVTIQDHISQSQVVLEAFQRKTALSTNSDNDKEALSLRVLFASDEVLAIPIRYGDVMQGYLVLCSTVHMDLPETEELEFLGALASSVSLAVQQTGSIASLEEQNSKLRELDELKDTFISITSHQLRTPLSIVKWILSILQTEPKLAKFKEQKDLIDQAYGTNERMIHVVNDLLNVSRIQEGKMAHNPITSNMIDLIKDQVVSYERLLRGKNLELRLDLPHQLPEMKLDPILFKEALQNLLDNAMDYNQELGGFVDLTVTEAEHEYGQIEGQGKVTTHAEPSILIRVTNPGLDIPKEEMEKIFDQFYRSSQALQHYPNGNGLGLFLAQAIIQQHGGKIEVESQKGLTSFTICLPWRTIKV